MRAEKEHWRIRPLREEDAELLLGWLTDPRLLEFYEGRDAAATPEWIRRHFYEEEEPGLERNILEYQETPIGYMQCYPADPEEYGYEGDEETVYAMDQWIAPESWNQGHGRTLVGLALNTLVGERGAQVILLDPHEDNPRAIRCYERCGFRKVKRLPAHEWHEGRYVDCLLMAYHPNLFSREIDGWASWAQVFQDLPAFRPLMDRILNREGMSPPGAYDLLTPGTNAVFRAGDRVLKIFAPPESGLDTQRDEETERRLLQTWQGILPVPKLLGWGNIMDRYDFCYLILEYVRGEEAGQEILSWERSRKQAFVKELKDVLRRIHHPDPSLWETDYIQRALESPRIRRLPSPLREDFVNRQKAAAERGGGASRVLVHGDLTGENVMVREDGSLCILDWADALPAAETYEWPPLVFELFRCDPELVGFFCEEDPQRFIVKLVDALTLHDFGADILLEWQEREDLVIDSLEELEEWLKKECLYD